MLDFSECPLYGLKSKKQLKYLLNINNNKLLKQKYVAGLIRPYIDNKNKPRLIEPPHEELKAVQARLKDMLGRIKIPDNVFSGIKGRSYVGNAFFHLGENRVLFKIDLTAFFPSTSREKVYRFLKDELCCSSDVANILTNFTTINIEKSSTSNPAEVYDFLKYKGVKCTNHLISGAPTSQILSYLVNHQMFDEMCKIANENNMVMTVYVDDVTFSSNYNISNKVMKKIMEIAKKYGFKISKTKVKKYTKLYPKLVTGVIIDSAGKPKTKNSLRYKVKKEFINLKNHPNDNICKQRLRGLLMSAKQIDKSAYPEIYKFITKN